MLVLTRKYHEKIRIGNDIVITVLKTKGKAVRLGIEAPESVAVLRGELVFDKESPAADAASNDALDAEPKARAGSTAGSRIPAADWAQNAKPRAGSEPVPGRTLEGIVLHERVPRRRLSQMMPPILGCDPSKTA